MESHGVGGGHVFRYEQWGDAALLASLAWSVLAIGGTLPWSVAGLLVLSVSSALINVALGRFRFDAGVAVLFGLSVVAAFQTIPIPTRLLQAVDGGHGETWRRVLEGLHSTAWPSSSLEPDTTRYEATRLLCYALTWGTIAGRAKRHGPATIAKWVSWLAVATALVTALHKVLGVQQVYGVYTPQFASSRWVGPLLNPNNLGGLCNLGVFCSLACTSRDGGRGNHVYFATAGGLACLTVLTGSRGATLALGSGAVLFLGAWLRARHRLPRVQHWGLAYAVVVGLTLVALGLDRAGVEDLSGRSVEKLGLLRWGLLVLAEHPLVGVGVGAFGAEVTTVSGHAGNVVFPYVECFPLDLLTGFGAPVALGALAAIGVGIWRIGGGLRTHALRLGLCVVLLQNFVDLGLSVPGVAMPWIGVFAACWGGATRRTWAASRSWVPWVSSLGAAAVGAALAFPVQQPAGSLRREISEKVNTPEGRALLDRVLARQPGDAYLLRTKAAVAIRHNDPEALAWVNAALLRAPSDARTHLLLAGLLLSRGRTEQALPSLRLAAMDRSLHPEIVRVLAVWAPGRITDAAPEGRFGAALLRLAAGNHSGAQQTALLEAAQRRAPDDVDTLVELTQAKLRRVSVEKTPCGTTTDCYRALADDVSRATRLGAEPSRVSMLSALLMALGGDAKGGFELLLGKCERSPRARNCLQILVELGDQVGRTEFEQAVSLFLDAVCGGAKDCADERMAMARRLESRGAIARAHEVYTQECSASGSPEAFIQAARTALQLGRAREALHWLDKGQRRHRGDAAATARLSSARADLSARLPAPGATAP